MHFLSLETSTKNFALAVSKDGKVLCFRNRASAKVLEDSILPTIDKVLAAAKVPFKALDAFAIALGPGSFTSLRVGLSTVKALCMATGKPVVGVSTLDVLAEGVRHLDADEICVLIDARRKMVYSALYQNTKEGLKRKGEYRLGPLAAVLEKTGARTLFVGDGAELYRKEMGKALFAGEKFARPQAKHLAKLAFERLAKKDHDDAVTLNPIYLYAEDCQVDANVRRS